MAGDMGYLTDGRGDLRRDPRNLLPSARSMVCVGKLYNTASPWSVDMNDAGRGWIFRYAWGADYLPGVIEAVTLHDVHPHAEHRRQPL